MGGHRSRTLVIRPNRTWDPITRMRNVLIEVQFALQSLSSCLYQLLSLLLAQQALLGTGHLRNIHYVIHVHKH